MSDPAKARPRAFGLPQLVGLAVGLLSLLLAGVVVGLEDQHEIESARSLALAQATDRANVIQVALDRALSASYALGAMVRQGGGRIDNFDAYAAQLKPYYPGVVSLQLAPGGVVQQIYPLAGNEKAIGHNLLADPKRNREAFLARDTRQLTLAGPFQLVQGGVGAVGRLPVFLAGKDSASLEFWGFANAMIGFPDLLREVGLPRLQERGYDYVLWKAHPDTGLPQMIAGSLPEAVPLADPVEYRLDLPNGHWTLGVAPVKGWRNQDRLAVNLGIGSVLSLLLGWLAMQMMQLHFRRESLTVLVAQRTRELSQQVDARLLAQKALVSEAARLAALLETVSDGIHILDANGDLLQFSHSFAAMLGYSDDEVRGLNVMDWDATFPKDKILQVLRELMQVPARFETRQRRKDGSLIDVEVYAKGVEIGGKLYLYNSARDISQRKADEQALRVAATAFESQQGMIITDALQNILRVNQAFTEITGHGADDVLGKNPRLLASGRHGPDFYAAMWASVRSDGSWQGEIWNRRKSGEVFPEWLTISAVKDDSGQATHYVAAFTDISARKTAEDQIRSLAFYDPLTRLPNRRLLSDRLEQALIASARHQRLGALLFVDLDNFKTLNDTLGHFQGDLLLEQVARRLSACLRERDTAARLGGDEFVVMLEDLGEDEADAARQSQAVGEKILAALAQPYALSAHEHHGSASIGITLFAGQQVGQEDLLRRADLAMYQAKAAGRNTLRFFDPQMQAAVTTRAALEADLREALQQAQFLLYYQAQVDGAGRLTGVEALLRWQHPVRGLVAPMDFIPLAEENGFILPLGHWVLEAACRQLARWAAQPALAHLTMAVNVSARQFHHSNFVAQVQAVLAQTGADPHRLKLELTESLLLDDVEAVIGKMLALKACGVGFSLDDFGTGYSSLSYLKRLPLDQLKIDQGFVRNILTDPNDAAIARMVVALAASLGLSVIAEGVEVQAQRAYLAQQGCHAFQGYLFSRPLPLADFEAWAALQGGAASAPA